MSAHAYSFLVPPSVFSLATYHWPQPNPIVRGSSVQLACIAKSGSLPIFHTWTDPDRQILSPGDTDGIISFAINIFGTYTCTATNRFGEANSTVDLLVEAGNCHGRPVCHRIQILKFYR